MLFTIFTQLLKSSASKIVISFMNPKPQNVSALKQALRKIRDSLPEETIIYKRLKACVKADDVYQLLDFALTAVERAVWFLVPSSVIIIIIIAKNNNNNNNTTTYKAP